MVAKIYGLVWLLALAAGLGLYLTGSFTVVTLPIIGLFYSTLAVMGFVAVLPSLIDNHFTPKWSGSRQNVDKEHRIDGKAS